MDDAVRVRTGKLWTGDNRIHEIIVLRYVAENVLNEIFRGNCEFTGHKLSGDVFEKLTPDDLAGKCDYAASLFKEYAEMYLPKQFGIRTEVEIVHGELSHNVNMPSKFWPIQHTMNRLKIADTEFWVDCTSFQFNDKFSVNEITVELEKPWWFYPDRKNPSFSKVGSWLNRNLGVKVKMNGIKTRLGIVEFFQYKVHGTICDTLRRIKK